jgi:hypothetical protein
MEDSLSKEGLHFAQNCLAAVAKEFPLVEILGSTWLALCVNKSRQYMTNPKVITILTKLAEIVH